MCNELYMFSYIAEGVKQKGENTKHKEWMNNMDLQWAGGGLGVLSIYNLNYKHRSPSHAILSNICL